MDRPGELQPELLAAFTTPDAALGHQTRMDARPGLLDGKRDLANG